MSQNEYLKQLEIALQTNGIARIQEILADYREHFVIGLANGKSEIEIGQKLGDPDVIAKAYKTEDMIRVIKCPESDFSFSSALKIMGRLIVLAPFNFLIVLIPGTTILYGKKWIRISN